MNPSDRELLEKAARAAGYEVARPADDLGIAGGGLLLVGVQYPWNPLNNSGQALELAVKLGLSVMFGERGNLVEVSASDASSEFCKAFAMEALGTDPYAATRRAIVRAAAALAEVAAWNRRRPEPTATAGGSSHDPLHTAGAAGLVGDPEICGEKGEGR